jgi:hypothetical protein
MTRGKVPVEALELLRDFDDPVDFDALARQLPKRKKGAPRL